ncbi:MAG: alanine racemase [Armatimonadota bacterium]|jgi:alanine racemase
MVHDVWIEVDLSALEHNFKQIRSVVPESSRIMAVVKGNGFGHGMVEPAKTFLQAGADMLAVTRLEEALALRDAGLECPILMFAPIQSANAQLAVDAELDMTVADIELARSISQAALDSGKSARVWVKVDTGMGRLGVLPGDATGFVKEAAALPGVSIAGIFTHFATAMQRSLFRTREQMQAFAEVLNELKINQIDYGMTSAANSAAIMRMPESHLDIVRPGTLLYGQYPSSSVPHKLDLKPTWTLKARICQLKEVPKGSSIGYGAEYRVERDTRIAILPVGYADGFTMSPEDQMYRHGVLRYVFNKARRRLCVRINGHRAQVLGRVAMQTTIIDVTGIGGIEVGDEAVIPARRIATNPLIPRVYTR